MCLFGRRGNFKRTMGLKRPATPFSRWETGWKEQGLGKGPAWGRAGGGAGRRRGPRQGPGAASAVWARGLAAGGRPAGQRWGQDRVLLTPLAISTQGPGHDPAAPPRGPAQWRLAALEPPGCLQGACAQARPPLPSPPCSRRCGSGTSAPVAHLRPPRGATPTPGGACATLPPGTARSSPLRGVQSPPTEKPPPRRCLCGRPA